MQKSCKFSKKLLIVAAAGLLLLALLVLLAGNLHLPSEGAGRVFQTRSAETQFAVVYETERVIWEAEHATETPMPQPTKEPVPVVTMDAIDYFLADTSQDKYAEWIRMLSGAEPVVIDGVERTIDTRYSYAMFGGQENAMAPQFLLQTLRQWVAEEQIAYEPYVYKDSTASYDWYNIIVTFPGTVNPEQQLLYTAHYDSCVALTNDDPLKFAPGANDNGTGVAALLEALPTFARTSFEKTVKVIFFSGEENFLQGSTAYLGLHPNDNIVGVVNMDMFGNDSDGDRCFEIHVGPMAESDPIGQAYRQAISDYDLQLTYDYFNYVAYEKGDHAPFWERKIPAITIMENFTQDATPGGCVGRDATPNWHLPSDHIEDVSIPYAYDIARAGTITVLRLAGAQPIVMPDEG